MKKRILSALLCAVLAATSIATASAADTSSSPNYTVLNSIKLNKNQAYFFKSGTNIPESLEFSFYDINTYQLIHSQDFNFTSDFFPVRLPNAKGYHYLSDGCGSRYSLINFTNTDGIYEKIKVKLSDFSDYFNSNGTHTQELFGDVHDYNFTKESHNYYSSLVFISGGAITAAAPDKNGMVEIHVSKKLGVKTSYMTNFRYKHSGGGGRSGAPFCGFTIGDIDKNGEIYLNDAILIQKKTLNLTTLDKLSSRNADVNFDGNINLIDVIKVQKYNLGIE
ncbi:MULTISPECIES: dockerin type I repeat-containing protein [unclassified Ruminococcus]|uniref:dockerin type I repeat-containing protein n=1 Tax=unclassified Ruminococcus TaxID=2608920 RepID=UPI00210B5F82|nr:MULTISPECIES: dockerin type I repeat-containing protein [unclassified Ruminococcus]MCQ4021468.1 hypothetical protein [Ruminococcus sp. zg-924]MCQ4113913.1 hypothetical protein [Ruminococcus sp. zg-921]